MNLTNYHFNYEVMDDLVNIANYCNSILIRYGQIIKHCNAVYIHEEDVININIRYRLNGNDTLHTYQYQIQTSDFFITDTEIQVNKSAINIINSEIERHIMQRIYN